MLGDFFSINMPYGMEKNDKNEWMFFNREYQPIGFNQRDFCNRMESSLPIYTKYKELTEKKLLSFAFVGSESGICRYASGEIYRIFFYNGSIHPLDSNKGVNHWKNYFNIIKKLSSLKQDFD